jgi:hypothetical protein
MKKLFTLLACGAIISAQAQVLYTENFEGASPTFTLNTSDQSSTTSGYNSWIINNVYAGGSFTDNICGNGSIPIATTPSQPGTITNAPNSKYMHIVNNDANSQSVSNANFATSDAGLFCLDDENYFTKMTSDISTVGMTGVTVSFYWMCDGSAGEAYGELYYSTDAGSSWNLQTGSLAGQTSWTQASITNSIFDNKATLRFGFRFVNTFTFSAGDPPLCVDEFSIFVPASSTIATGTPTPAPAYCAGATFTLPYTIGGTYTAGNVFTAQLSDGVGSFASPTTIGSVTTTSAGNINCTVPAGTTTGIGYMVRVISSTPSITGTTYGPFTINALPVPSPSNTGPYCAGTTISLNAAGGSADYDWTGPLSYVQTNTQNPSIVSSTTGMSGVYTVTATTSANCSATGTTTVSVLDCSGIEDSYLDQVGIFPNPTTDVFTISIPDAIANDAKVSIINLVGEQVYTMNTTQSKTMISTQSLGLKAGIYLVQIRYNNQNKVIRLIVR